MKYLGLLFLLLTHSALATTYFVDGSHPNASDQNAGTSESAPWKTPYAWIPVLAPGDTVLVKNGTYDIDTGGSWNFPALNPDNGGTATNPITLKNFPDHSPKLTAASNHCIIGAANRDYLIIEGFDATHTVVGEPGGASVACVFGSTGVELRQNSFHGKSCPSSWNCSAIRIEDSTGTIVADNRLFDIWNENRSQNSSGLTIYHSFDTVIEHNEIFATFLGVFHKFKSPSWAENTTVRNNWFHDLREVRLNQNNHTAHNNIVNNANSGIKAGNGSKIFNNSITGNALRCHGFEGDTTSDVEMYNNICYNTPNSGLTTDNAGGFCDFNLGFQTDAVCGGNSLQNTDPLFVSIAFDSPDDWKLQSTSSAKGAGRFGEDIGAYATGTEVIGPRVTEEPPPPPPPPPPSEDVVISNISVDTGKAYLSQPDLAVGNVEYIDRGYTYSAVPVEVEGHTFMQTANDDKTSAASDNDFLRFSIDRDATIYVAHDNRITTKPAWLDSFVDIGVDVDTTDVSLSLFGKNFPQGNISLGGNGGTSGHSMYTVMAVPLDEPPPPPPSEDVTVSDISVDSLEPYTAHMDLAVGDLEYIDRDYTYSSMPVEIEGHTYIRTANDDKFSDGADSDFLRFTIDQDATIYVAHDNRITTKPSWLGLFTDTGIEVETTDVTLTLFKKDFTAGQVSLGGNGAMSSLSMYTVMAVPVGEEPEPPPPEPPPPEPPPPSTGQIIVDPQDVMWLKYQDGGSFFMCGPGDPEDFLYRGSRNADGTRSGDQMSLINKLIPTGANSIYMQIVRSHGGDGNSTHNPFIGSNPANGLDQDILNQWETWFTAMDDAGIVIFLFFYDDSAGIWSGDSVNASEHAFIKGIVDKFEHHQHLIWVVAEEYQEEYSAERVSNIASVIRQEDDNNHVIAVHKLSGLTFSEFADDPNIEQFAIQHNVTNPDSLHDGMVNAWNNSAGRYNLNMSEATSFGTGSTARAKTWAVATGGAYVMALGWDIAGTPVSTLEDCGVLRGFMERAILTGMEPHDELKFGNTLYVLADPGVRYIAYSNNATSNLGLQNLPAGTYDLNWLDISSATKAIQAGVNVSGGDTAFTLPSGFSGEVALYLEKL